jgi:hypothetical protein
MPRVFISHLSDDNLRLGVYIDRLLEDLDNKIDLWIDTPEHIRPEYGSYSRIKAIPPGTKWGRNIDGAVEDAACVLVFWSANFGKKSDRSIFIGEVDDARSRRLCVQVAIDPMDGWEIPSPFNRDQILEVSRLDMPGDASKFRRAIERVNDLISAPEKKGQPIEVEVYLLPYHRSAARGSGTRSDRCGEDRVLRVALDAGLEDLG